MSPTTTTTLEHFAADGPIGPSIAIAVGIALSLLISWTLFRESHVLGRRCTLLFWVLRLAALAVVLWMLLAPMKVLVETSTTRKAIVIATDISGSMQTVDPAGTSDDVRWALAGAAGPSTTTEAADRAVVALGVALRQLQLAREALQQRRQDRTAYESVSAAAEALSRVREHLRHILDQPPGPASSDKCRILANRVIKMFESAEFSVFGQVAAAIGKNRAPQNGWQEGLPDLEHRVASIKTVLQELARIAAQNEGPQLARDNPNSMASLQNVSRLDRAVTAVESLHSSLSAIREKADVRYASFDHAVHGMTSQPSLQRGRSEAVSKRDTSPVAPGTNLTGTNSTGTNSTGTNLTAVFDALQRERQQQPFAAVIVLSDVAHNQSGVRNPRDVAATLTDTPTYVVPVGNTRHVRDVRLHSVFAPTVAMRNDDIVIEASLQAFECEGEVCVVKLLQDGKAVDQREVVLDSGFASRTVRFERQVQTLGTEHFRIAIETIEGELSTDNNERDFEVNVTRSDIKVLLADEFPRWEYRYLTQLFRRDDKVQCDELLFRPRMIATGRREATNSFPVTVDDWDQYDVVMLGDVPSEHLPVAAQESLVAYLAQRGGTLVTIAGQVAMPHAYQNQPLAEVLPVAPVGGTVSAGSAGFEFRITSEGRVHPALMIGETEEENAVAWDLVNRNLPLAAISPWRRPLAAARTLIAAVPRNSTDADDEKNSAFLCWQPVGRGRIVYLAAPESYRLRFLRGDRLHYRFWGQLLRWAIAADLGAGSQYVRVRTDKSRYESREAVQVTVRLANAAGEPVVAADISARMTCGNDSRTVPLVADPQVPGEYRAEISSLPPGEYRIEPVGAAVESLQRENQQEPAFADLSVHEELSTELTETRCDRALAQQIADMTGGQVVPPTAISEVLALTNLEPIVSTKVENRPLWVQWKYLWIVFGCLQLEWIVRKRLGLS